MAIQAAGCAISESEQILQRKIAEATDRGKDTAVLEAVLKRIEAGRESIKRLDKLVKDFDGSVQTPGMDAEILDRYAMRAEQSAKSASLWADAASLEALSLYQEAGIEYAQWVSHYVEPRDQDRIRGLIRDAEADDAASSGVRSSPSGVL